MWKKEDIKLLADRCTALKGKVELYLEKNPKQVIAIMFFILLAAVTGFVITRVVNRKSYASSIEKVYEHKSNFTKPHGKKQKPVTAQAMEIYGIYNKASSINPDSLTEKDSVLLKEINKDLNNILHEKD